MAIPYKNGSPLAPEAVDDANVEGITPMIPPACIMDELPMTLQAKRTVIHGREQSRAILSGKDDRLLVVVGPCSIHDIVAGREYATKLLEAAKKHSADLFIVMRVYFEKPRTTMGWKGLINDPDMDNSFKINKGLRVARQFLLDINELGLPCGCEFLDTISPQFTADLVSWGAIGARTTESQVHRELASGLSTPVGFKNGTDGSVQVAVDACLTAQQPHHFMGVTKQGLAAIIHTKGNPHTHVILRGSSQGPNYSSEHIRAAVEKLWAKKMPGRVMIDCSHGNSNKDHRNQEKVALDVSQQLSEGSETVIGVMLESFLVEGRQDIVDGHAAVYGQSVTDACVSWEVTGRILDILAEGVRSRRQVPVERRAKRQCA
eukprot:TRINITY_DN46675_c0_g1_i1.p1 TRINITY_DN46675_c0_g1~~TRINITY_DN46675_c0_g1_i1.p1  ORF type:complete len:389 (-),score=63.40 TRINITY_DN46675_c0_g1_i1:94-1218(-)